MGTGDRSAAADEAEAALQWQASAFPDSAASFSVEPEPAFSTAAATWGSDARGMAAFLAYQTHFARGMDLRTQAAHLMAVYSHHLSLPVVALFLKTGRVAQLDPERVLLALEAVRPGRAGGASEARRFRFVFPGAGAVTGEGQESLLGDALVAHLAPVVSSLKRETGLSEAAQWRLAADSIAGALLDLGRALGMERFAIRTALDIVGRPGSPLHSPELSFETITTEVDGRRLERTFRLRGGCCLYYRTEDGRFCDVCVLLDGETRRRRLRSFLERGY